MGEIPQSDLRVGSSGVGSSVKTVLPPCWQIEVYFKRKQFARIGNKFFPLREETLKVHSGIGEQTGSHKLPIHYVLGNTTTTNNNKV